MPADFWGRAFCFAVVVGLIIRHTVVGKVQWMELIKSLSKLPLEVEMVKWLATWVRVCNPSFHEHTANTDQTQGEKNTP